MEFEMEDEPRKARDKGDSRIIKDHKALRNQSSVKPEEYPNRKDRALHIPEQEDG